MKLLAIRLYILTSLLIVYNVSYCASSLTEGGAAAGCGGYESGDTPVGDGTFFVAHRLLDRADLEKWQEFANKQKDEIHSRGRAAWDTFLSENGGIDAVSKSLEGSTKSRPFKSTIKLFEMSKKESDPLIKSEHYDSAISQAVSLIPHPKEDNTDNPIIDALNKYDKVNIITEALTRFKAKLDEWKSKVNDPNNFFFVVALYDSVADKGPLMVVTAQSKLSSTVTQHMGIFRTVASIETDMGRGKSIELHRFAAKAMREINPACETMRTNLHLRMREIFMKKNIPLLGASAPALSKPEDDWASGLSDVIDINVLTGTE